MDVNYQNQVSNIFHPPNGTIKRKRGRPRKYPRRIPAKTAYVPKTRGLSQNHGELISVPPGFEGVNRSQPQPVVGSVNSNYMSPMVGQVITGVIEADFEGGYLLSVRVGNSDTRLNGVIFKSGQYVPVCPESDLAPGVSRIRPVCRENVLAPGVPRFRNNEVPFPANNQTHEHHAVFQSNGTPASNQAAQAQARQLSVTPVQAPRPDRLEGRGTLVPVVLQPTKLSNGVPPAFEAPRITSQPAHLAASKNNHICPIQSGQAGAPKGSETHGGSTSKPFDELVSVNKTMNGAPRILSQPPHLVASKNNPICPFQSVQAGAPKGSATHGGSTSKPFDERVSVTKTMNGAPRIASQPPHLAASKNNPICQAGAPKSSEIHGSSASKPFDELVNVAKTMNGAPVSMETRDSGFYFDKMLGDDSSFTQNGGEDLSKPLFAEHLQTINSGMPSLSAQMPPIFPERRFGKMTDLLLSMQRKAFRDPN